MNGTHAFSNTTPAKLGVAAAATLFACTNATTLNAGAENNGDAVDWSGFYVGGHLGWGEACFSQDPHSGETSDGVAKTDPSGLIGGMQGGYNWQWDSFVLGLESEFSATGWGDSALYPGNGSRAAHNDVDWMATLRLRLGMPMDSALFYVTGGLAYAKASFIEVSPDGTFVTGNHEAIGGVVGLGADWRQNDNFSWRVEGLYYMFDDSERNFGTSTGNRDNFKNSWVVRLGCNYHF